MLEFSKCQLLISRLTIGTYGLTLRERMKLFWIFLFTAFLMVGCVVDQGKITVSIKKKEVTNPTTIASASVTKIQIIDNQLVITGSGLSGVSDVKIDGHLLNQKFIIQKKSASQIIANATNAFTFDVSKIFNLIISSANATATFPIDFSLCDASFNCFAADKDVLSYDAGTGKWKPRAINGLSYQGAWDANDPEPTGASNGDYYIVSVASAPYAVGDWIVWNGSIYDQINNSTAITSVFGRTGAIVGAKGDYNLNQLTDIDLSVPATAGKILKYNGSKWIAGDDLSGGGAGSVTSTEIVDGAVTDVKITGVSTGKLIGTINSAQILDGTIVNADISGAAAIDYTKLNIPSGSIAYNKLNINDGDIPVEKISGLPSATTILSTSIVDSDSTHAPDGNAVFDALFGKLSTSGGTLIVGTISGVPTPVNPSDVASKAYVDATVAAATPTLSTDDVAEATNLYFTGPRVSATVLTGLNTGLAGPITVTDSVLTAFGRLQYQLTTLNLSGQWIKSGNDISYAAGDVTVEKNLKLKDSGTNYVLLKAPAAVTSTYTLTLPSNPGSANQVLQTNGAGGVLSWSTMTDASVQTFAKSALPTCAMGEVLKSNGASFSCVTDNAGAGSFSGAINKAVSTDGAGALITSTTTSAELGYVTGVTSSIQAQLNAKEGSITAGTTAQYYRGDKSWQTLSTTTVPEGTSLYFMPSRVLETELTGFSATNSAIVATDSVLDTASKAQGQIDNLNTIKANRSGDTFTGDVNFNTQVKLKNGGAANYITVKAPAAGVTAYTISLPPTAGSSNQVLTTDGAGVTTWTTPAASTAPSGAAGGDLSGSYPNPAITGLAATKISTGVVNNTEFNYLSGVTSSIQAQLSGKQALDATLTALAAYNSTGIIVQTAVDTFTGRSIANTANRTVVTNGNGVVGNPTIDIDATLLPSPNAGDAGKFLKSSGTNASSWTALAPSDVTTALGFTPINKAGDILATGTFTFNGAALLRTLDPVLGTDVANKQYVDSYGQWTKSGADVYRASGSVGVGTATPAASSLLDLTSTTKGFAPPRMTKAQRDAIASPVAGLFVFNTTDATLDYYNGANWLSLNGSAKYIKLKMSGYQTVINGSIIAFDAVATSSGMSRSGNGVALKAGVTYRIESSIDITNTTVNNYLGYALNNGTTNIGAVAYTSAPNGGGAIYYGFKSGILEIYKPAVDQVVYVKVTDNNIGTGQVAHSYNTNFVVTELVPSGPAAGSADNLGNHTATQNIALGTNWLSGDGGNEGLKIDSAGNVAIGSGLAGGKLSVADSATMVGLGNGAVLRLSSTTSANSDYFNLGWLGEDTWGLTSADSASHKNFALMPWGGTVGIGTGAGIPSYTLQVNGSVAGTSAYANLSDERFKKDITKIPNSLEKLILLEGVYYNWRTNEFPDRNLSKRKEMGVIAQKVEKVFPEAITKDKKGFRSVAYSMLIAPIIESVKELYQKIIGHEEKLNEQGREIASLKQENAEMKAFLCSKNPEASFCRNQEKTLK